MDPEAKYERMFQHYACKSVPVTLTRRMENRNKVGRTWTYTNIWIPRSSGLAPFPCDTPPPGKVGRGTSLQFFGVHSCLTITLCRPAAVDNMLRVSECLPEVEPLGPITWIGSCRIDTSRRTRLGSMAFTGWCIGLLTSLWQPSNDLFQAKTRASMLVHHQKSAVSTAMFTILTFPAISRKLFDRPLI